MRLRSGLSGVAMIAFAGVAPAQAQDVTLTPEAYLGAATACIDWIASGGSDAAPFDGYEVETAFVPGNGAEGGSIGAYRVPGTELIVSMETVSDQIQCTGQGGAMTQEALGAAMGGWLQGELGAGRLVMMEPGTAPDFLFPIAICAGDTGGFDMIVAEDDTLIFYAISGATAQVPEGVCG